MSDTLSEYRMLLQDLMAAYKNPKSSASAWLRKELHNVSNPEQAISDCFVTSSIAKAKSSRAYIQAAEGSMQFICEGIQVEDFGVLPDPAGGDGFIVFIRTNRMDKL